MNLQRDVTLSAAVERMKKRSLGIRQIISVGAGSGSDSIFLHERLCSEGQLLLIEAQDVHVEALTEATKDRPNLSFTICAAAEKDGEVHFLASGPTGGAVTAASRLTTSVPARSIDSLVRERGWDGPFMLKFDTHGVEMEILAGAKETLPKTALVMMEVYNFKLNFVGGSNLLFFEMCRWMRDHGLRCVDLCEPLFRPNDQALWQMQMFFVRDSHPVFNSNSYSAPAPPGS